MRLNEKQAPGESGLWITHVEHQSCVYQHHSNNQNTGTVTFTVIALEKVNHVQDNQGSSVTILL